MSGDASGLVHFNTLSDGSYFFGNVSNITINNPAAANAPEPATLTILGAGPTGLAWVRRRRNR